MAVLALLSFALSGGVVHGTVRADSTLEPIAHAVVEIPALGRTVAADDRGYYVLTDLPAGWSVVRVSALGYQTRDLEIEITENETLRLDVALTLRPLQLEAIEVTTEGRGAAAVTAGGPPPVRVDGPTLSIVPGLAEADVLRALQTLPAVTAISDFSSALYVRGGAQDQNLLLLDGAPLFNPFHLGGVFAAFDPSTIATVDVMPGAFPASAGDRMSSVISLKTRDGGRDRVRGQGAIGLISSRASVDGPLPGGRGSYLVSLRRTYVDLFTDVAFELDLIEGTVPYAFTDGHLKVTHDVGALGSVAVSLYLDREGINLPEEMVSEGEELRSTWGSYTASVRYRQPFGGTLLAEFRTAVSAFAASFEVWGWRYYGSAGPIDAPDEPPPLEQTLSMETLNRDALVGADLTWYGRRHRIAAGIQLDAYAFDHEVGPERHEFDDLVPPFRRNDRPATVAGYVEDHWSPTDRLRLRGGLRALFAGTRGTVWMPRFGARWEVAPGLAFNLGGGRYAQVMHSLRDEESFFATIMAYDMLASVPEASGPPVADDIVLGAEWRTPATEVRVDGYLKRTRRLSLPPVPADPLNAPAFVSDGWREGSALARGVEALARHRRGETELSLSYALAFAELEAAGEKYPPRYERRHTVDFTASTPLGERGLLSARLAAATGQPYTPVVGEADAFRFDPDTGRFRKTNEGMLLLGDHNSARLPGYLRVDVAARKEYDKDWFGGVTLTPYFQVINVLNNKNVLFSEPNPHYYPRGRAALEYLPQLPFLPTFGVEWRF